MLGPPMSIISIDLLEGGAARDGLAEGVEVDDDEVDRGDPLLGELFQVGGALAVGQDAAVDRRVERLHPPAEDLGRAGDGGDRQDRDPLGFERRLGAAGGEDLDAELGEAADELDEPSLVVDRDESAIGFQHGGSAPVTRGQTTPLVLAMI